MTDYPKGSEGAAEQKTLKKAKIAMALATLIAIALLWFVPLLKEEAGQTGTGFKVVSWILFGGCFAVIYFEEKITNIATSATLFYLAWFFSFGFAFFLRICGGV